MDVSAAGAFAAFTYRSALQSGTPAQALLQAFQAASAAGAQMAALDSGGRDGGGAGGGLLQLFTQAPAGFATYQLSAQAGTGDLAIRALLASTPGTDQLLAAGMDARSSFPVANPDLAAALSGYQFSLALGSGTTASAYAQQLGAAAFLQGLGSVNLLA